MLMPTDPGLAPLSTPPSLDDLDGEARVEAMVNWFYENFEDPVHETSYNGREGGYLYLHGGPYEAADYIPDAFPDATEEEHTEAIDQIEADGPEFAPAGHRILPPNEDYDDREPPPPLDYRLDQLSLQMDTIGRHVEELIAIQRREQAGEFGMGHNHPPEPMEDQPDLREVLDSIREVKAELAKPDRQTAADPKVVERAEGRFSRFMVWLSELTDKAPMALALGAVGGAGKMLFDYAVAHHVEIQSAVIGATQTMAVWVGHLTSIL